MHKININNSLFIKNRENLVKYISPDSIVIIHANDEMPRNGDQYFSYRQNSDMFYLTGINEPKTILVLCPQHPNFKEIVFVSKPNEDHAIWYGYQPSKEDITAISGIKQVMWLGDFDAVVRELIIGCKNIYLNTNEYIKFIPDVEDRNQRFTKEIKGKYPLHNYHRIAPLVTSLRLIKDDVEIELIKKACEITSKAFLRILKFIKPGCFEYEVEAELSHEFAVNKANGHAYYPIIASGENACTLHYTENKNSCKDGDLLLLDFGAEFGNFASDCSRTIPVNGKFTERQKACYQAMLNVHKKAMDLFIVGNTIDKLNNEVNKLIENELIKLGLFTKNDVEKQDTENPLFKKYYMHGVSHFIGLDVHDVGSKQDTFKEGMVLSCEPGIYIKEEKIGIRIENDILITKQGPVNLTKSIPMEIDEIEKLMQKS
ncbi:MAG: aminopeptidase P N-terminal domain-containing protein [Bacteroidetes bacterium]|nr:aminopeptidase P N-terminal domain-containing protein [Bacteroidota bacterium]